MRGILYTWQGYIYLPASSVDEVGLSRKPTSAGSLAALKLGRAPQISLQLLSLV